MELSSSHLSTFYIIMAKNIFTIYFFNLVIAITTSKKHVKEGRIVCCFYVMRDLFL